MSRWEKIFALISLVNGATAIGFSVAYVVETREVRFIQRNLNICREALMMSVEENEREHGT